MLCYAYELGFFRSQSQSAAAVKILILKKKLFMQGFLQVQKIILELWNFSSISKTRPILILFWKKVQFFYKYLKVKKFTGGYTFDAGYTFGAKCTVFEKKVAILLYFNLFWETFILFFLVIGKVCHIFFANSLSWFANFPISSQLLHRIL